MSWVNLNAYLASIPQSEPTEETPRKGGKKKPEPTTAPAQKKLDEMTEEELNNLFPF